MEHSNKNKKDRIFKGRIRIFGRRQNKKGIKNNEWFCGYKFVFFLKKYSDLLVLR